MDYQKQATDFLTRHGIMFTAVLIGSDCPRSCEDAQNHKDMDKVDVYPRRSHIHGKHYRCTFSRGDVPESTKRLNLNVTTPLVVDFWNSYHDEEYNAWRFGSPAIPRDYPYWDKFKREWRGKRKLPTPYDVLSCIQTSEVGTFEDFCLDFGYDNDSRKAEEIYHEVVDEYRRVSRFFTSEELAELQE